MKNYQHKPILKPRDSKHEGLGLRASARKDEADAARVDLSEIWDTIREEKWIILLTCILVVGAIAAHTFTQEPVYEAASIVSVNPPSGESEGLVVYGRGSGSGLADEVGLLQYSAELPVRVARRLQETADAVENEDYLPVLHDEQGNVLSDEEAGSAVFAKTSFDPFPEQHMIRIEVKSGVPEEAAAIANAYAKEYQEYSRERSRASVSAARRFLEEQAEKRKAEITELEEQWATFARQNDVMREGEDGSRVIEEYTALESQRAELEFEREQEERELQVLQEQLGQFEPELRNRVVQEQETAEIQSAIQAVNEQIATLRAEATQYYVANPDLKGDTARIEAEFPQLAELGHRIQGFEEQKDELVEELIAKASGGSAVEEGGAFARVNQLQSRITEQELVINQLDAQIQAIDQRVASYDSRLANIPDQRIERNRLEQRRAQAEQFYGTIVERLQSVIIQEESELGYVRPVRSAVVPTTPVSPNVQQNMLLGLLLGLGFGIGLAFLRRAVADYLRTPEDLQEKGYSLVGVIPEMRREIKANFKGKESIKVGERRLSTHLVPLLNPWSPIAENYRLVRTNLQHSLQGKAPQVILVTSPEKGDGKTLTAANLAITMAQSGRRTVLLDADLRRPNAHRLLGVSAEAGIADVLNSEGRIPDHIIPTEVDGLHFLPAGHTDLPPAEALGGERMEHLIERLRNEYDVVIIDSPPVLAVSDPVLLATQADATLLVVSAERTNFRAVDVTEKTLNAVGVPVAGVIFNRFDEEKRHGYGYGYDYDRTYSYALDE